MQKKLIIISAILAAGAIILLALFFLSNSSQGTQNEGLDHNFGSQKSLSQDQLEYSKTLLKFIGIPEGVILNPNSKEIVSLIINGLNNPQKKVLFNGKVYKELELSILDSNYYFKPKDFSEDSSEYFQILNTTIGPTDLNEILLYFGDELQREVIKIFYESQKAGGISKAEAEIKAYLDTKKTEGVLKEYNYDELSKILKLHYTNNDLPWLLELNYYYDSIDSIISANKSPQIYSNKFLEKVNTRLDSGEIILINTLPEKKVFVFVPREVLLFYLSSSLEGDKKESNPVESMSVTGNFIYNKASFEEDKGLINTNGDITPLNKTIYYWQGADYLTAYELADLVYPNSNPYGILLHLQAPVGGFSTFLKNGYAIKAEDTTWGEKTVEYLEDLLSDDEKSILFLDTHGGNKILQAEIHYIGTEVDLHTAQNSGYPTETIENIKNFKKRGKELVDKYGADSIEYYLGRAVIHKDQANHFAMMNLPQSLAKYLEKDIIIGVVYVKEGFFKKHSSKKSLIFLLACHGGSFANILNSRVLLAVAPENTATVPDYYSDLRIIDQFLLKYPTVDTKIINQKNLRNFNIVQDLDLTQIKLYGEESESISISPHVKLADGGKIVFNVPMNQTISPSQIVTADFSKCENYKNYEPIEPKWVSERELSLPWLGAGYREWKKDSLGLEKYENVPLAKITIHNNYALSKSSNVQLTGNPNCCDDAGCKVNECWQNPTEIKYNATQSNSDFVFFMPCISEEYYYESCGNGGVSEIIKVSSKSKSEPMLGDNNGFLEREIIKHNDKCFKLLTDEIPIGAKSVGTDWEDIISDECMEECATVICKLKFPTKIHWKEDSGEGWFMEGKDYSKYVFESAYSKEKEYMFVNKSGWSTYYRYSPHCSYPCEWGEPNSSPPDCWYGADWSCTGLYKSKEGDVDEACSNYMPFQSKESDYSPKSNYTRYSKCLQTEGEMEGVLEQCDKMAIDSSKFYTGFVETTLSPFGPLFGPNGEFSTPKNADSPLDSLSPDKYYEDLWGYGFYYSEFFDKNNTAFRPGPLETRQELINGRKCYSPEVPFTNDCIDKENCINLTGIEVLQTNATYIDRDFPESVFDLPKICKEIKSA